MILRPANKFDVEWMRLNRNRPELYKYFRQDRPITKEEQWSWWEAAKRLWDVFVVEEGVRVGCVTLGPGRVKREFGIWIVPEYQGHGYGKLALIELLNLGFGDLATRNIYSDVLQYPKEDRFEFYRKLGFKKVQSNWKTYLKQGVQIPADLFEMTVQDYNAIYTNNLGITQTV